MPHGERSCGSSAVLIEVSPGGDGAALTLGALVLGAGAFAGPESSARGCRVCRRRWRGGRRRHGWRGVGGRRGHRSGGHRWIGGRCGRTANGRRRIGERGGRRHCRRLPRSSGTGCSRVRPRARRGGSIGLRGRGMGECNQRQQRRKHGEYAETERQSPCRRGSRDAATAMATPRFRLHVSPTQATQHADVTDRKFVQQMTLFNKRRYNVAGRKSSRIRPCAAVRRALELIERKFGLFSIFVCARALRRPGQARRRASGQLHALTDLPSPTWCGQGMTCRNMGRSRSRPHAGSADRRAPAAVTPAKQEGFAARSAASAHRSRRNL